MGFRSVLAHGHTDPGERWNFIEIEGQRRRCFCYRNTKCKKVIHRLRLEVVRSNRADRVCTNCCRVPRQAYGFRQAIVADMHDDLERSRSHRGSPAFGHLDPFGRGQRRTFAGRSADKRPGDAVLQQDGGLSVDGTEVQGAVGIQGRERGCNECVFGKKSIYHNIN